MHPLRMGALVALTVLAGTPALAAAPAGTSDARFVVFTGDLDAAQVVGGSASSATGSAVIVIDTLKQTISTELSWTGLTGPADRSHQHSGATGMPSDSVYFHSVMLDDGDDPPFVPCPEGDPFYPGDLCLPVAGSLTDRHDVSDGYWGCPTFTCILETAIPNGFYVDIHTALYPGGEIRGQMTVDPRVSDAWARSGRSGPFTGEDIINRDAAGQSVRARARAGQQVTFQVVVANDADAVRDRFLCAVLGGAEAGFGVRYFAGGREITRAVVAGTYRTAALEPGEAAAIRVVVDVGARAAMGSRVRRLLTFTSASDAGVADAVRVVAERR